SGINYTTETLPTYIGSGGPDEGGYFCGIIDDLKIYNYPRPVKAEIVSLRFDEGAGTTCEDSSPQLCSGEIGGTVPPMWCSGKYKYALDFNGYGIVDVGGKNAGYMYTLEQITLEAWIRDIAREPTDVRTIISVDSAVVGRVVARLSVMNISVLRFEIYDSNRTWHVLYYTIPDYNRSHWYHVSGTFDGCYMRIYTNGILSTKSRLLSGNNPLQLLPGPYHISIGGRWSTGGSTVTNGFHGIIDEVKVLNYPECFREDSDGDGMSNIYEIIRSVRSDEFRPDEHNDRFAVMVGTVNDNNNAREGNYIDEYQFIFDLYWSRMYLKSLGYRDDHILWLTSLRPKSNGGGEVPGGGWTSYPDWYDGDAWKENLEKIFNGLEKGGYERLIRPPKEYLPNLVLTTDGELRYIPETPHPPVPVFFYDVYPYGGELNRVYVERTKASDMLFLELRDHGDSKSFKMYKYRYYEIKKDTPNGVTYERYEGEVNCLTSQELTVMEKRVTAKYLIDSYDFCGSGAFAWEDEIIMKFSSNNSEFDSLIAITASGSIRDIEHPSIVRWNETIIYLVYEGRNETGMRNIYISKSTNSGDSFTTPVRINNPLSGFSHLRPKVAVDSAGYIHVTWLAKSANQTTQYIKVMYARSANPHNISFSIEHTIDSFNHSSQLPYPLDSEPHLAVYGGGNSGKVCIVWTRPSHAYQGAWRTYYALSSNNGNNFTAKTALPGQKATSVISYRYPAVLFYAFQSYLYLHVVHCDYNETSKKSSVLWEAYNYSGGTWFDSAILANSTQVAYRNSEIAKAHYGIGLVYEKVNYSSGKVGIYFKECVVTLDASSNVDYYWWPQEEYVSNESYYATNPIIIGGNITGLIDVYHVTYQSYGEHFANNYNWKTHMVIYRKITHLRLLPMTTISEPVELAQETQHISNLDPAISCYSSTEGDYLAVAWNIRYAHTDLENQIILTSTDEGVTYRFNYLFYGRVSGEIYAPFILRNDILSDGKLPITTENAVWFPAYISWDSNACKWNRTADGIRPSDTPNTFQWQDDDGIISVQEAYYLGAYATYLKGGIHAQLLLSKRLSYVTQQLYL
ncbi:MAG: hypothetical protein DRH44_08165, partial [Candidatus Coatesbacteria bacterium]